MSFSTANLFRTRNLGYVLLSLALLTPPVSAEDLLLTMSRNWPGNLLLSEGGTAPRETYRHNDYRALGANIPRIAAVTYGAREGVLFAAVLMGQLSTWSQRAHASFTNTGGKFAISSSKTVKAEFTSVCSQLPVTVNHLLTPKSGTTTFVRAARVFSRPSPNAW